MAQDLGVELVTLQGNDVTAVLMRYVLGHNSDQLVIGQSPSGRWAHLLRGSVVRKVPKASLGIEVHVVNDQRLAAASETSIDPE